MAELERLQKYMARSGVGSRRHCEELIVEGRVAVNRVVVRQLGVKVNPAADTVTVDGIRVSPKPEGIYVMLNKPTGVITTVEEQRGRPTVVDLIQDIDNVFPPHAAEKRKAAKAKEYRLFPVGRLDFNTEGLLLLTNDGELANRLTHPRYALEKEYFVQVRGRPSEEALGRLRRGLELDGELTAPAQVRLVRTEGEISLLTIVIHEGRKRQVRRMFEAVGYPVQRLLRTRTGPLKLGSLPAHRYRFLNEEEVTTLRRAVGIAPAGLEAKRPTAAQDKPRLESGKTKKDRGSKKNANTIRNSDRRS